MFVVVIGEVWKTLNRSSTLENLQPMFGGALQPLQEYTQITALYKNSPWSQRNKHYQGQLFYLQILIAFCSQQHSLI